MRFSRLGHNGAKSASVIGYTSAARHRSTARDVSLLRARRTRRLHLRKEFEPPSAPAGGGSSYVAKHLIANPAQVNQSTSNSAELSDRRYCHDVEEGVKPGEVGWVARV